MVRLMFVFIIDFFVARVVLQNIYPITWNPGVKQHLEQNKEIILGAPLPATTWAQSQYVLR